VGNGSHNLLVVGSGSDTISVGTEAYNTITLGSGADTVTLASPTPLTPIHDIIHGGAHAETIYLGAGSYNTYNGVSGKANTCHLPTPPSTWHGTAAAYYNDTITNCTVVTP
jgi:Ca2+-binding RTX toxin-like protein